jgi:polo-like kinase 1
VTPTYHAPGGSARSVGGVDSARGLGVAAVGNALAGMASQQTSGSRELWVTKWVDYSSKYGVGYTLSDGSLGVYFNDSTKIILVGSRFDYITRRTQDKPEVRSTYTLDDYPDDLKKKTTLLRHFKNYMSSEGVERKDGATVGESGLPHDHPRPAVATDSAQAVYVKKWTRNKHAILFQLSNKIVQVLFFDKTEAVLSSKSHTVTYVDKSGQLFEYPLSSALDVPNAELSKRLRYTRDILVNLLGIRTTELAAAAQ